ncbi:MAG TPA: hypothetical protein DCR60_10780, partial [Psychrobacter sp.]|nr:hypothetical protein [Psychrobacter sp.]
MSRLPIWSITTSCSALLLTLGAVGQVHADSMGSLIAQKSYLTEYSARYTPSYPAVPAAKISTRSTIQRANTSNSYRSNTGNTQPSYSNSSYANKSYSDQNAYAANTQTNYRYPQVQRQVSSVLPAFLSGNYDNVDSEY